MIIPPKLFTDARKDYDLCDVEILSKWTIELGLQYQPEVRSAFERVVDVLGTHQFYVEFTALHQFIMNKQREAIMKRPYHSAPPTPVSPREPQQGSQGSALLCIVPSKATLIQNYPSFMNRKFSFSPYSRQNSGYFKADKRFSSPSSFPMRSWSQRSFQLDQLQNDPDTVTKIDTSFIHDQMPPVSLIDTKIAKRSRSSSGNSDRCASDDDEFTSTTAFNIDNHASYTVSTAATQEKKKLTRYSSLPTPSRSVEP